MSPYSTTTHALPRPLTVGVLMLGAALALVPLGGHAQDSNAAASPEAAAAPAAGGGDTGAPSAEAAAGAAASPEAQATAAAEPASQMLQVTGILKNGENGEIGSVVISETASGILHFVIDLSEGALPAAQHGLHIHTTGMCEGPDFQSAGGHLAGDKDHGIYSASGPHAGDLPNITMGAAGAFHAEYFLSGLTMDQIMDDDGSAVMIHSDVDDYASQPAGNAGDRIACAVLEQNG